MRVLSCTKDVQSGARFLRNANLVQLETAAKLAATASQQPYQKRQ